MHVQMKQHIPIQKQQQHTLAQQKASYTAADKELRTHFPAAAEARLEYSRRLTHHPRALHTNQPPLPQVKQPPQTQRALVFVIRAITEITNTLLVQQQAPAQAKQPPQVQAALAQVHRLLALLVQKYKY